MNHQDVKAKIKEMLTLAEGLREEFILKRLSDVLWQHKTRMCDDTLIDLNFWNTILHYHYMIRKIGMDKVIEKIDEFDNAMDLYQTLKQ